ESMMRPDPSIMIVACFCSTLLTATAATADVIRLKSGQTIQGEVLKEVEGTLYVDLGVDVVRVPRDEILAREKRDDATPVPTSQVQTQNIYSTATLPGGSVKSLAEKLGEGVVLVQTPSGLGSGFVIDDHGHVVTNYHVVERETQ